jgi:hypothetical protein
MYYLKLIYLQFILNSLAQAAVLFSNEDQAEMSSQHIKIEPKRIRLGETMRLECPQANPTWFFRPTQDKANNNNNNNGKVREDLIVTRHGIINADYKFKILCHMTLKHQVIIINNVEFNEEGLYTCLYTKQPQQSPSTAAVSNGDAFYSNENENIANLVQYRHVFNVTVFSKIIKH